MSTIQTKKFADQGTPTPRFDQAGQLLKNPNPKENARPDPLCSVAVVPLKLKAKALFEENMKVFRTLGPSKKASKNDELCSAFPGQQTRTTAKTQLLAIRPKVGCAQGAIRVVTNVSGQSRQLPATDNN